MLSPTHFDPVLLKTALEQLTPQQRLLFALSCTERLLPNYAAFAREQSWGDPGTLRAAVDVAWEAALGSQPPIEVLNGLRARVAANEPETTEHSTILVSAALDAAVATGLALDMLGSGDAALAVEVATLARDSVDMYVQAIADIAPSDPDLEDKILAHELMRRELRRQADDLAALRVAGSNAAALRGLAEDFRRNAGGSLDF